jgi:hypothetical protein
MSPAAGRFVTERFEYNGGRQVTAYLPSAAPEAIVFAGDGQLITSWAGTLEESARRFAGAMREADVVLGGWRLRMQHELLTRPSPKT